MGDLLWGTLKPGLVLRGVYYVPDAVLVDQWLWG